MSNVVVYNIVGWLYYLVYFNETKVIIKWVLISKNKVLLLIKAKETLIWEHQEELLLSIFKEAK